MKECGQSLKNSMLISTSSKEFKQALSQVKVLGNRAHERRCSCCFGERSEVDDGDRGEDEDHGDDDDEDEEEGDDDDDDEDSAPRCR